MSNATVLAATIGEDTPKGVYVVDLGAMAYEEPAKRPGVDTRHHGAGVLEKWVVKPSQTVDDTRLPVTIVSFPPNLFFPRHWHTDGEFIAPMRGEMMVGGVSVGVGGMGYNDARTIYGAEAAGADGCEFLMIRRAWARNNVMLTDEDVAAAVSTGITNSQDEVAPLDRRGLHVLDTAREDWTPAGSEAALPPDAGSGTTPDIKRLVDPRPGEDRFPISLVRLPPGYSSGPSSRDEGLLVWLLEGEATIGGEALSFQRLAYVDAGCETVVTAGGSGAVLATFSRAPATSAAARK